MENPTDFRDWESLQDSNSDPEDVQGSDGIEEGGDSDNGISPDYFSLESDRRYTQTRVCEKVSLGAEEGVKRSWIDPNSHSWFFQKTIGELGLKGVGVQTRVFGGSWTSDESSDDQKSPCVHGAAELGIGCSAETECFGGGEGGRTEEVDGVMAENFDDSNKRRDQHKECCGDRMVWWKLPLEVLKLYAFKVRPIRSISIVAALFGVVMLGRKLYNLRKKTGNVPIKISNIDDKKKASQFMARAARLNEAFSVVRRLSIIRTTFPAPGMTPWPAIDWR